MIEYDITKDEMKSFYNDLYSMGTAEMASLCKCDCRTVRKWLSGERVPSDRSIAKHAVAVQMKDLLV